MSSWLRVIIHLKNYFCFFFFVRFSSHMLYTLPKRMWRNIEYYHRHRTNFPQTQRVSVLISFGVRRFENRRFFFSHPPRASPHLSVVAVRSSSGIAFNAFSINSRLVHFRIYGGDLYGVRRWRSVRSISHWLHEKHICDGKYRIEYKANGTCCIRLKWEKLKQNKQYSFYFWSVK